MLDTQFVPTYEPLLAEHPEWASIAILPWDSRTFGIGVADLQVGHTPHAIDVCARIDNELEAWALKRDIALVSCSLGAEQAAGYPMARELGFALVDYSLRAGLTRLQRAQLPMLPAPLRLAEAADEQEILRIARSAFRFGRYHTDACFPTRLASRRYEEWMRRAFAGRGPEQRVYLLGERRTLGFFHVVVRAGTADLRLGAVDESVQNDLAGFQLYLGTLRALKAEGVRSAVAKVSAGNTAVLNVYSRLGFQFSQPAATFHRHFGNALSRLCDYRGLKLKDV